MRTTPALVRASLLASAVAAASLMASPASATVREHCAIAAHRGDWSVHTQNGLPAMRSAIDRGADYLEIDVRTTRDGRLVLMHNAGVRATTNGVGQVADMTLRQIAALRLDDGSRVPTLTQVFEQTASSGAHVLVDMKAMGDVATFRDLARQVRSFGRDRVRLMSRTPQYLDTLTSIAPGIPQGIVTSTLLTPEQVAPYDAVMLNFDFMTPEWLDSMPHPVYAWTLNDEESWNRSEAHRLAAVITDAPADFMQWRESGCPSEPATDELAR